MPIGFAGAPLADLLPVTLASDWSPDTLAEHQRLGFHPRLTPEGAGSILKKFQLSVIPRYFSEFDSIIRKR